jgi:undecaprenyl diphosphate synthase
MIYWLYEQMLSWQISMVPRQICFMISGADMAVAPEKCVEITRWCNELSGLPAKTGTADPQKENASIQGLTFHINTLSPAEQEQYIPEIKKISAIARLVLHYGDTGEVSGTGMEVVVAIGKSGREEITACIRRLAEEGVLPQNIDEKILESHLTFRYDPDIVIKSGGDHLTDFLIWQSVYSELFFSDVNWKYFRKVDFLRILRDYQSRMRRFGK